jgi:hypothetical protein
MKKLLLVMMLLTSITTYSQEPISMVTDSRDTLWLVNNDIGKLIYESWEDLGSYDGIIPVIIFKSPEWINKEAERRELLVYRAKNE